VIGSTLYRPTDMPLVCGPHDFTGYAYPVTSGRTPEIQCTRGAQPFLLLLASVGFDARFPDQTG
jgi:hypothetical protein